VRVRSEPAKPGSNWKRNGGRGGEKSSRQKGRRIVRKNTITIISRSEAPKVPHRRTQTGSSPVSAPKGRKTAKNVKKI